MEVINRIDVANDPVNWVDSLGLYNPTAFKRGMKLAGAGIAGMAAGAGMSATGGGAVIGIPTAIAGAGTFAGGVVQAIVGWLEAPDQDHVIPPGSLTGAATLATTGDINKAIMNDALADVGLTGAGVVCGAATVEKNLINMSRAQAIGEAAKLSAGTAAGAVSPTINFSGANN